MRTFVRSLLFLFLIGAATAPLGAQDIKPLHSALRSGFWWGLGLGAARAKLTCSGCTNPDPEDFPMVDFRAGFTPSERVTIGFQLAGGSKKNAFYQSSNITESVGDFNVSAYVYPSETSNFFMQGGLSGVVYEAQQGSNNVHLAGGGLTVGIGYDIRYGRNGSLTPTIRGVFGGEADLRDQNGNMVGGPRIKTTFIQLGLDMLWH